MPFIRAFTARVPDEGSIIYKRALMKCQNLMGWYIPGGTLEANGYVLESSAHQTASLFFCPLI